MNQDNQDEQILALLANPSTYEKGFRLLVSSHSERMYWQIRRMVFSHDDADDVLQNAFVKVYRSIKNFKGNSKLYTWLHRIAINESITFLNKKKKMTIASIDHPDLGLANQLKADDYFDGNEAELKLQQAIAILPDKQREAFCLRYHDEMTYKDMSELTGTSIGGLKASYHHALKKIENYIKHS
ncbi:MAG: RNA polymerase sigma-70 factor (ECF subfamily) [Maribacter sp.]|jgi:RNA polymerase sigma-70 factor (ECF subfamily)